MSTARKGGDAERAVARQLRSEGYLVVRSAASKGPVDLVAIDGQRVMLIQLKYNAKLSPAERKALEALAARVPRSTQVWTWERWKRETEWRATRIKP
jgi:Holliday junction resolvase